MKSNSEQTVWDTIGRDKYYEHYRTNPDFEDLRRWVDDAYYQNNLAQILDGNFLHNLRNEDIYGRLWELEVAEWLKLTKLRIVPTGGKGPDFCIQLDDNTRIWIEAVLARPDEELNKIQRKAIASKGKVYATPRDQIALRYSSSLVAKADKIREKYANIIAEEDFVLIAISAYAPDSMRSDIDLFLLGVMPIEYQVVHFSTNGEPLDENIPRPSHTVKHEHEKKSGVLVKK